MVRKWCSTNQHAASNPAPISSASYALLDGPGRGLFDKLLRALSQVEGISIGKWAKARGYGRYLASSIKGEAAIDWSDKRARTALLAGIVADADRLRRGSCPRTVRSARDL